MSYLQKIADLQARAEESRNQARQFQNEVREDAFNTAEAKKEDFLGHISRGIEDMTKKLDTAGAVAATTGAIAKHIKKLRSKATESKKAPDQEKPKPTPEEKEEKPSSNAAGADKTEPAPTEPAPGEVPPPPPREGPEFEDAPVAPGFEETNAKFEADRQARETRSAGAEGADEPAEIDAGDTGITPATESVTPEGQAIRQFRQGLFKDAPLPEDIEVGGGGLKPPLREGPANRFKGRAQEAEAGGDAKPAPLGEGEDKISSDELTARIKSTAGNGNFSTEGNVGEQGGALAEEGAGESGKSISGLMDGLSDAVGETAGETAASAIGDVALGAIPVIGDIALAASLIGSVVEGAEGAKKEEKAEEEMSPKEPAGVAVATTGIDGKSLLEQ